MVVASIFGPAYWIGALIGLAVSIYVVVDVLRHPDYAWQASGQSKTLWLVLAIVGFFVCWLVIDLIYLLAIRPKVAAAQNSGNPMGGGGYGTGTYGSTGQYGGGTGQYGGATGPGQYGGGAGQYGGGIGADTGAYGSGTGQYGGTTGPGQYGGASGPGQYGAGSAPGQYGGSTGQYGDAGGTAPGTPPPAPPGTTPALPPPGWYPDPAGSGQPRYWNGQSWAP